MEGLIINTEGLVSVLNRLMDREGGIVELDRGVKIKGPRGLVHAVVVVRMRSLQNK